MATIAAPAEQRIVLHDISWETYEGLLADHGESSAPRFTYDRGELEILSPSPEHEFVNRTLALLVELVAEELGIESVNVGSMTFKRTRSQQGFEPDSSFYIQHADRVLDLAVFDVEAAPPADLIIEIEITRSAIPKLPIYAAMDVPEVWRWDGQRVNILRLTADEYAETERSLALPPLTSELLTRFIIESQKSRRTAWMRSVREWARTVAAQ